MKYYITSIKGNDEFTLGTAGTEAEAIAIAREEWHSMNDQDQSKNVIEVRHYKADVENEGCVNFDYDTVIWDKWYAVIKDNEDNDWGYGSYDYDEAVETALAQKAIEIAVIRESTQFCEEEICLYDSFRVSAVFADGTTIDNDIVYRTGKAAIESEIEDAREWFADKEPVHYMISYYRDGELYTTEERQ